MPARKYSDALLKALPAPVETTCAASRQASNAHAVNILTKDCWKCGNEAAQLGEAGLPVREIAGRLDMHPSAVSWHCLRLGADSPRDLCKPPDPVRTQRYMRSGHVVRRFTPEEDEQLLHLEAEGLSAGDIAQHLNRRRNSIVGRLMTLARQETRNEARAAQLQNDKVHVAGARSHDLFPAQPVPPTQKGQMQ